MAEAVAVKPVTRHEYWAALDALTKAQGLEDEKYQAIVRGDAGAREAMAAWWKVAAPRWRELEGLLLRAETEDWAGAMIWLSLWREARKIGRAPGSVDADTRRWPPEKDAALKERAQATAPRRIEKAGSL